MYALRSFLPPKAAAVVCLMASKNPTMIVRVLSVFAIGD